MNFKSDNISPISPEILNAIMEANFDNQHPYGMDEYSIQLQNKFSEIFETDVIVYLTSTGTAANCLALSTLLMPHQSIVCHKKAHVNTDECGAPALFTGGSNLLLIDGEDAKINPNHLQQRLNLAESCKPRMQKPGCVTVTQSTECGTIYSVDELKVIYEISKRYQLPIHMDGARFTNSLVTLGVTPAELTWKVGVDVMSFGGTKNGCLNAEAIVFFNHKYADEFQYRHKMAGQQISKNRFFAAQFLGYFKDDLWLKNARHANDIAQLIKKAFEHNKIKLQYPVEANALFPVLSDEVANYLVSQGFGFYPLGNNIYRFVASCFSLAEDVTKLDLSLSSYFNSYI